MNRLLRHLLCLGLGTLFPSFFLSGQCPKLLSCPSAQVTVCDFSTNDTLLWNDEPLTWSPVLLAHDLYEAGANLSIAFSDTCGAAPEVSYTIFFDLEQDNLYETVITSAMVFPPGQMLYNNAFTPGYLEGDTLRFDKRQVPDSLKYRFALEVTQTGLYDWVAVLRWNTQMAPFDYAQARLPEGRHRIQWKVVSGGVTRTCEYNFRVRDCLEPEVYCLPPATAYIGGDRLAHVNFTEVLDYGQDNICPENLLSFGIREAGTGTGFPLNAFNLPEVEVAFACSDTGMHVIDVWGQDLHGNAGFCQTSVVVYDTVGYCVSLPNACARAIFGSKDTLDQTTFELLAGGMTPEHTATLPQLDGGCSEVDWLSIPSNASFVRIRPFLSDNALNGVSTFDLVVISKHILNLDPFVHPWQYVAADVNYSNTVTTFDIAQIRKLILGLTDTFPNNVSWRFLAADCALPNVPLPLPCMNSVTFSLPLAGPLPEFDFYGIKLGDVNGSAVTQTVAAPAEPRGTDQLMFPDMVLDAGALTDVPVRLNAAGDRLGLQVALRFDADVLEVADVQAPGLPDFDASCWAVVGNEIRLSWATATPQALLPDAPVFVLRVRARTEARLRDAFELVSDRLPAESYAADGSLNKLQLAFNHRIHAVNPVPQPNPSAAGTQWPLRLKEAGSVQFQLVDSQGRLCHEQNQGLEAGAHWLVLPDRSDLYPGVYTWRIRTAEGVWTGQWVKI